MRQYAGFGSAKETNARFKYLLSNGQTGLSVAFDLPTQLGMDSDHPLAIGEVGKVGVSIDTLHDMETVFDGIPLDRVSTSMTINATAAILLAMYIAVAKKQNVSPNLINGTIQNDVLKEYIARGLYIYPPTFSLRLVTDIFAYCQYEVPNWNTISISGYHIREAGATAVQELAFTFGNAITYVQAALDRGLNIDAFAPRISFFFDTHNNFLEEIAKFRAARRIWAKLMKERFRAQTPRSWMLRFHARNGWLFTKNGHIVIKHSKYKDDPEPIDASCGCIVCRTYSRAYLRHLFLAGEILSSVLNTIHNLYFYLDTIRRIRQFIEFHHFNEFLTETRRMGAH